MNTFKSKPRKCKEKNLETRPKNTLKTDNGETEVFVLPPDLLQKLGIKLENVDTVQESSVQNVKKTDVLDTTETAATDIIIQKEPTRDSSILKTADLMKTSVLLSPTFATSVDINPGEFEIAHVSESITKSSAMNLKTDTKKQDIIELVSLSHIDKSPDTLDHQQSENAETRIMYDYSKNKPAIDTHSLDRSCIPQEIQLMVNTDVTDVLEQPTRTASTDEHPDEAYSSDCSNSNCGHFENSEFSNYIPTECCHASQLHKECPNKIKILSEEIMKPSQINEIKILYSPKRSAFIPVSINSVLESNKHIENIHNKVDSEIVSVFKNPINYYLAKQNKCMGPELVKSSNNSEVVLLFDEKGKPISTTTDDIRSGNSQIACNDLIVLKDVCMESLLQGFDPETQYAKEHAKQDVSLHENSFGVCIDFVATDIEMHLKEDNEDILESFVNEITSNENNGILKKIEESELDSPVKTHNTKIKDMQHVTNIHNFVERYSDYSILNNYLTTEKNPVKKNAHADVSEIVQIAIEKNDFEVFERKEVSGTCQGICEKDEESNKENNVLENRKKTNVGGDYSNLIQETIETNKDSGIEDNNIHSISSNICIQNNYPVKGKMCENTSSIDTRSKANKRSQSLVEVVVEHIEDEYEISAEELFEAQQGNPKINKKDYLNKNDIKDNAVNNSSIAKCNIQKEKQKFNKSNEDDDNVYVLSSGEFEWNKSVCNNNETETKTKNNSTNESTNKAVTPEDKVKEIAMYLSQFAKTHASLRKSRTKSVNSFEILTKRSKQNPLKSKMYIHGVEKPGGSMETDKKYKIPIVLKTYNKSSKPNKKPADVTFSSALKEIEGIQTSINDLKQEQNINEMAKCNSRTPEFCNCSDFGRKAFYDSVSSYEHLHFWQRNIVDCDLETVFSIYADSHEVSSVEAQIENATLIRDQKEDVHIIMHSICWHYFEHNQDALIDTKDMQASDVGKIDDLDSFGQLDCSSIHIESVIKETGSIDIVTRKKSVIEPCVMESSETKDVHMTNDATIHLYGLNKVSNDAVIDIKDQVSNAFKNNENMVRSEEPVSSIKISSGLTDIIMIADNTYKTDPEIKIKVTEDIVMKETVPLKSDVEIRTPGGCQETNDDDSKKTRKKNSGLIKKSVDVKKQRTLSNSQQSKGDMFKESQKYSLREASTEQNNDSRNNSQSFDQNQIEQSTKIERKNHNVFSSKEIVTSDIHIIEQSTSEKKCETSGFKKLKNKSKLPKVIGKVERADEFVGAENNLPLTKKNITDESFEDSLLHRREKKRKRSRINYSENDDIEPSLKRKSASRGENKTKNSMDVTTTETTNDLEVQEAGDSEENNVNVDVSSSLNDSICAVCRQQVPNSNWMDHIAQQHDYLAWKDGENPLPLDDDEEIRQYLMTISKQIGNLKCSKCGLARKYPKVFMQHIRNCTGSIPEELDTSCVTVVTLATDVIKCGVCNQELQEAKWISHIQKEHDYLAWKLGEPALDKDDVDSIRQHLNTISKQNDGLICIKCGMNRRYANSFLHHIKQCTGEKSFNVSSSSCSNADLNQSLTIDSVVKCGVCQAEVASEKWIQHVHRKHEYMAWKEGESLDLNNKEEVEKHLSNIVKQIGYLVCGKCGMMRKYIKNYLEHVNSCSATPLIHDDNIQNDGSQKKVVCAICLKKMDSEKWSKHKMEQHYNVAWTVGSRPVNFKSSNVIDVLIKEYRERYKKMKCKVCGITRASCIGFYAHVVVCGKSEEEADIHRDVCEICDKKYLYVYRNQHMAWHREQELIKEEKLRAADEEEKVEIQEEPKEEEILQGRRAAQKARSIIQKFKSDEYTHICPNCQFGADSMEEIQRHVCNKKGGKDFSDSEDSVNLDGVSEDESDDSEFNSEISEQEEQETERKREREYIPPSSLLPRFPYTPKHPNAFFSKSGAEFRLRHYTNDALFPALRRYNCEVVPDECLSKYLPPLEESCQVQFCDDEWVTYKRFEAKGQSVRSRENHIVSCSSIFVGACIQCMAWAPPGPEDNDSCGQFLAVACHRGADVTRINVDKTLTHPGLIQLWNFGKFSNLPKLEFGIAHDFGVPWAMDWCPSGARDVLPEDLKPEIAIRLGLLAVAFSNGRVYIFFVPYPSTVLKNDGKFIHKLKPVMELRLTMNSERKIYQATSVSWSPQKNHESIVVGYSDGTMAFYNITTDSPLLKSEEKDLEVIYPYYDEKAHNTCITGVGLYPGVEAAGPAAVLCSSSSSGAALVARPGVRPAKQQTSAAVGSVQFQPLWPSVLLVGDEGNMSTSISEIEFWACGRRMGGASAAAGCLRCGRLVLAALPLLRARTPHPAKNGYRGKKQDIFAILQITPLSKKRKKLQNDELQMKVEPTTYEDAIKKYGIEFKMDQDFIKQFHHTQSYPERIPERFPLGDVPCMAFCQSQTFHKKLAVASHAGVIFLVTV